MHKIEVQAEHPMTQKEPPHILDTIKFRDQMRGFSIEQQIEMLLFLSKDVRNQAFENMESARLSLSNAEDTFKRSKEIFND